MCCWVVKNEMNYLNSTFGYITRVKMSSCWNLQIERPKIICNTIYAINQNLGCILTCKSIPYKKYNTFVVDG